MINTLTIINEENFYKIKDLLYSKDKPSQKVALSILEECDLKQSRMYVLLLIKNLNLSHNIYSIKDDYPNLTSIIYTKNNKLICSFSFENLYNICKTKEEKDFVLSQFKEELESFLSEYGYSFFKKCDLIIKNK
tara:strand:- start:11481 stop:11882 length:402 start_codon:yes stop_codon:yes gene_type:complete